MEYCCVDQEANPRKEGKQKKEKVDNENDSESNSEEEIQGKKNADVGGTHKKPERTSKNKGSKEVIHKGRHDSDDAIDLGEYDSTNLTEREQEKKKITSQRDERRAKKSIFYK